MFRYFRKENARFLACVWLIFGHHSRCYKYNKVLIGELREVTEVIIGFDQSPSWKIFKKCSRNYFLGEAFLSSNLMLKTNLSHQSLSTSSNRYCLPIGVFDQLWSIVCYFKSCVPFDGKQIVHCVSSYKICILLKRLVPSEGHFIKLCSSTLKWHFLPGDSN